MLWCREIQTPSLIRHDCLQWLFCGVTVFVMLGHAILGLEQTLLRFVVGGSTSLVVLD
ncbi:hypothetical protein M3J09_001226 [Ascochyta lentis]